MNMTRISLAALGALVWATGLLTACSSNHQQPGTSAAGSPATAWATAIDWQPWSDHVFADAQREHKFVILDLEAVWCHWCHVMDETTYADPNVRRLIAAKYIAVKVDQDSRPDLSNRYEDYGWPATIVFNSDGSEIVKRQGYLTPPQTANMLQAIIDDPSPGPSVQPEMTIRAAGTPGLSPDVATQLNRRLVDDYDSANGGWGRGDQKFLQWENVEYELSLARSGDASATARARQSLAGATALIDPVWGGIDQYSTDGDWKHPHFEKIMQSQAEDLRIYSLAYAQLHDAAFLDAANSIHRYLTDFLLAPKGGFYTSQDADLVDGEHAAEYFALDDAGRRKLGVPRIDMHKYTRETAWAARALVAYWTATGDASALTQAQSAVQWAIKTRSLPGGGFSHDLTDAAGPYLGDTLEMGRAMLDLYAATAQRSYLDGAENAARFIEQHFLSSGMIGIPTSMPAPGTPITFAPRPELDENVAVIRFANLLATYTGNTAHHDLAVAASRLVFSKEAASHHGYMVGGILLADAEMNSAPLHLAVVGSKSDAGAAALFDSAARWPVAYKQVEWIDRAEPPLPGAAVIYPSLDRPAAYVCSGNACSSPAFDVITLAATIIRATKPAQAAPLGIFPIR